MRLCAAKKHSHRVEHACQFCGPTDKGQTPVPAPCHHRRRGQIAPPRRHARSRQSAKARNASAAQGPMMGWFRREDMPVQGFMRQPHPKGASAGQLRALTACNSWKIHSYHLQAQFAALYRRRPCRLKRCHHFGQRAARGRRVPRDPSDGVRDQTAAGLVGGSRKPCQSIATAPHSMLCKGHVQRRTSALSSAPRAFRKVTRDTASATGINAQIVKYDKRLAEDADPRLTVVLFARSSAHRSRAAWEADAGSSRTCVQQGPVHRIPWRSKDGQAYTDQIRRPCTSPNASEMFGLIGQRVANAKTARLPCPRAPISKQLPGTSLRASFLEVSLPSQSGPPQVFMKTPKRVAIIGNHPRLLRRFRGADGDRRWAAKGEAPRAA